MLLRPDILALALGALQFGETRLVLVVLYLVSRNCHLIAPIASNWLVRADNLVLLSRSDVKVFSTMVFTVNECLLTLLAHVSLHLIQLDVRLAAAIWTPEDGFVHD